VTWVYRQLFHDPQPDGSGTDALLTRLVAPAVEDLTGCGAIDRFFFLRYAEDGPHVRLRLRVSEGADPAAVASKLDALAGQCPLVTRVVHAQYEPELVQIKAPGSVDDEAAKDDLFDDAVRVVLETKRGSVSLLQRRLTIGYSRASRLIEAMAAAGIVGNYKGSQAREAQITLEEWEAMKAVEQTDADSGMTV